MPKKRKPRPEKRLRVRAKRLDQLDESKLALAFWLLAQQVLADEEKQSSQPAPKAQPQ